MNYAWSNGSTTEDLPNIASGNYWVLVTDNNGCTATTSTQLFMPAAISITGTHTDATCNASSNGSISISVSGGNSPYSYSWSNNASTQNIDNIPAGVYNVVVTDANGCVASNTGLLYNYRARYFKYHIGNDRCSMPRLKNGSINASIFGGTIPYHYEWSNHIFTEDLVNVSTGTV